MDTLPPELTGCSPVFLTVLGCSVGVNATHPVLIGLKVTCDGMVLARHEGNMGFDHALGISHADLLRNLNGLCDALAVSTAEREELLAEAVTFDLRLHATHYSVFRWPLEQALTNLIDNTVKYATHPLPITIAIEETDDERLLFIVRDQGVGIALEDLERIFTEAFYRSQAHPNQTVGAGIGLNLARRYVEAQGGRLWAQSEGIGKGSAFYLQVPAERGEPGES